jgi:phosphatidylethanolamine/phosphatidyl-N-methylethanolamine N-methyltransferase
MAGPFEQHRVFWRQFRQQFHTTGAIAPSGRFLGKALARFIRSGEQDGPRRILEVGPGTGAVTAQICRSMRPDDSLDLVELNDDFVRHLNARFDSEFGAVKSRSRVLHCRVEELHPEHPYDVIVSGLPLNNFAVSDVELILRTLRGFLKPGTGTLSFFEYVAIRRAKSVVGKRADRERLQGISRILRELFREHQFRCDLVLPNLPPAWVHHVRFAK